MNKNLESNEVSGSQEFADISDGQNESTNDLLKITVKKGNNLKPIAIVLGVSALTFLGIMAISQHNSKKEITIPKTNLVKVAKVLQRTMPVEIKAIGIVQSSVNVSITSLASGQITRVYFQKGQEVKKGQLLFALDSRTQESSLRQAQATVLKDQYLIQQAQATMAKDQSGQKQAMANLAKDSAQAKYALVQSNRYNSLYKGGAVTLDQAQQYTANAESLSATVEADHQAVKNAQELIKVDLAQIGNALATKKNDEAALQNAKVLLTYTKIHSPIDGKAGNILIYPGNIVQANGTSPLVTINKIHPIQVVFSIPEANLSLVQKYIKQGKLKVKVTFPGEPESFQGVLSFINNAVDNSTGTLQLIGDFQNKDGHLFPGQFVNTTLTLTQEPNSIVVPTQAVQNGPKGQFVFLVGPDNMTVKNLPVTISSAINGLSVVASGGLKPGNKVVIDGQANLINGSKIKIKENSHDLTIKTSQRHKKMQV